jgi:guanyl-specific ribonuclease Sa
VPIYGSGGQVVGFYNHEYLSLGLELTAVGLSVHQTGVGAIEGAGAITGFARAILAKSFATQVPPRAFQVLDTVISTGKAPKGYVGGRVFQNREGRLPLAGNYREYDIDPRPFAGQFRNPERIIVDKLSGSAYYTPDHYLTFIPIR